VLTRTVVVSRLRPTTVARVGANTNPATYPDPSSDSGTAPDITSVFVSNDANNQITFRVNVASLVVPSDARVLLAIDSDQNASTGASGTPRPRSHSRSSSLTPAGQRRASRLWP